MLAGDEQSDENKQTQVETRLLKQNVCVLVCVSLSAQRQWRLDSAETEWKS